MMGKAVFIVLVSVVVVAFAMFDATTQSQANGEPVIYSLEPGRIDDVDADRRADELTMLPAPSEVRRIAPVLDAEAQSNVSTWPDGEEIVDQSGLTHEGKIRKVLGSYDRYALARSSPMDQVRVYAEYLLAVDCAVTVLRSQNKVQYTLDVDNGSTRGFRIVGPTENSVFVAADNGKYEIFTDQFPAVMLARIRLDIVGDPEQALLPLTNSEITHYDQCTTEALSALGVHSQLPR